MDDYLVSLTIDIEADSPEDAAREMINWIKEQGPEVWVYAIEYGNQGEQVFYDALTGKLA